ncbi:hypothetical protein [Chitinophaga arvensicola]|uniref:Uncharacterized protein n=1 Tax=Chitinophaga arvensicola TaxID=29529 RepID=A0A1I0R7W6_9BACT|nr:hypothetical protein [Chitinophaga arvensicola]SEW36791.1 hypothetical protein SAMN04488122_2428 [Chitinophaga arvensicola]
MKILFSFILLVMSLFSYAQQKADCRLLKYILDRSNAKVFKLQFIEDKHKAILLVDTSAFFDTCTLTVAEGRTFQVAHNARYMNDADILRVYVSPKEEKNYQISLYSKDSHGICTTDIKVKRGKVHWSKIRCGTLD